MTKVDNINQENRKKRRRKKNIFNRIFIGIILLYFSYTIYSSFAIKNIDTVNPIEETFVEKNILQGFLFMDESLYGGSANDEFKNRFKEGNRIQRGVDLNGEKSNSGIISYKIDGYENKFIPYDWDRYTYELLDLPGEDNKILIRDGIKIIKNYEWHLAFKVSKLEKESYEIGDIINIYFSREEIDIYGRIVAINEDKDGKVYIVRFSSYLEKIYDNRFPEIHIISMKEFGLKIPTTSIFEDEGVFGVYIKELNGIVKFRAVNIIYQDNESTIVSKSPDGFIKLEGEDFIRRTITIYDEVFINPNRLHDGQILN